MIQTERVFTKEVRTFQGRKEALHDETKTTARGTIFQPSLQRFIGNNFSLKGSHVQSCLTRASSLANCWSETIVFNSSLRTLGGLKGDSLFTYHHGQKEATSTLSNRDISATCCTEVFGLLHFESRPVLTL